MPGGRYVVKLTFGSMQLIRLARLTPVAYLHVARSRRYCSQLPHSTSSVTVRDLLISHNGSCRPPMRPISTSLTSTSTATVVHAYITDRLDYHSALYAGSNTRRLGCLQLVISTAARLIRGCHRAGRVSDYMLNVLHWLPFQQRIIFPIAALAWRCLLALAPA